MVLLEILRQDRSINGWSMKREGLHMRFLFILFFIYTSLFFRRFIEVGET